jgi:putative hemolysin
MLVQFNDKFSDKFAMEPIPELQKKIASFTSIEEALDYFDIGYERQFIEEFRLPLTKRFNGNLILAKPQDWFAARRALKNAYCKIQRGRLDKHTRSACRGCTTCQRR